MSAPIPARHLSCSLPTPADTERLAAGIGARLRPGDCLLLSGPVGAGKSHFARALIRARLAVPEDIPSPTYTLVQTYAADDGTEIWHADLYRLSSVDEVLELGLAEAWQSAICLIEWPDRLDDLAPGNALRLSLQPVPDDPDARTLRAEWRDTNWNWLEDAIGDG